MAMLELLGHEPLSLEPTSSTDTAPRVGVVAVNSRDYVITVLNNLRDGVVTVPLRSADDAERIQATGVREVRRPEMSGGWLRLPFTSAPGRELAQISFTSGTEGAPKGVLLSAENLHDVTTRLVRAMALDSDVREYVGVPVYHSFGYGRCRAVLEAGGEVYVPPAGFDLEELRRLLQQGRVNAISAVPTLWRLVLDHLDFFGDALGRVRWIEVGSQYMSAQEKIRLRRAFPNARILQHYGLTEASRSTFLHVHEESDRFLSSVGRPSGDVQVRINAQGRIEIRGPNVASRVLVQGEVRTLPEGEWLETSDAGRIEDGRLFFEGRADDLINCGGVKLAPEALEASIRKQLSLGEDFCIARRSDTRRGDGVLLALTPAARSREKEIVQVLLELGKAQGASLGGALQVEHVDALPRTSTGKVARRELTASRPASTPPPASSTDLEARLRTLAGSTDGLTMSFAELGGDSLLHIELSVALRSELGGLPTEWEHLPLSDILALLEGSAEEPAPISESVPINRGERNGNPRDIGFWDLVREDLATNDGDPLSQGFLMLLVHRFGNWRMDVEPKVLRAPLSLTYRCMNKCTQLLFGMKLDYTVRVGRRVKLEHFGGMILGARRIGNDVYIRQNTTFGIRNVDAPHAKPTIGNNVDIGAGAVIVGDIEIGSNSIVGANSVVYFNVPANSVVSGVPARIVGRNQRSNPSPLRRGERDED